MRKHGFVCAKTKAAVTAQLISAFGFSTESLYFLFSEISNLYASFVMVQPGLFWTWLETPETDF